MHSKSNIHYIKEDVSKFSDVHMHLIIFSSFCFQNQYRAEYDESMKGVGWMPLGSLEAEKNKKAMEILSEKKYRQHPDKLKYSVPR